MGKDDCTISSGSKYIERQRGAVKLKYIIGIDIGGTNFRIGAVRDGLEEEMFEQKSSAAFHKENAVGFLMEEVRNYISRYNLQGKIEAISIGVPSIVSKDKSFIYSTPNLKGLENIDLGHRMEEVLHIPVFIDRDVNYLLAHDIEKYQLDPDKEKTVLGFYLGTGFGNAVYINGKIHSGKNGVAGELGHIPMYNIEEKCPCGNYGCAELRCSGKYLSYLVEKHFPDIELPEVFVKYKEHEIIQKYIELLSYPMATEINILDPDYVLLAGGVIMMKEFPIEQLKKEILKRTRKPYPAQNLTFICTQHNQYSGVLGGATMAFAKMKQRIVTAKECSSIIKN